MTRKTHMSTQNEKRGKTDKLFCDELHEKCKCELHRNKMILIEKKISEKCSANIFVFRFSFFESIIVLMGAW